MPMQQGSMDKTLPLSWQITDSIRPLYCHVQLPLSRIPWITFADIPSCFSLQILYEDINRTFPGGYIIRGCTPEMARFFSARHCHIMRTGAEAVLDPGNRNHLQKKTVRSSLRRGGKHGFVEELKLDDINHQRFNEFRCNTIHAHKPQLRNLFRETPSSHCRLFVFRSYSGVWLGAITLSARGRNALHTELMLRHRNAPGDIMECLVSGIFEILSHEKICEWSLGEAPFMHLIPGDHGELNHLENLTLSVAQWSRYAYNFEGLYRFKNKFTPEWRPVMLCTNTQLTPLILAELSEAMGFTGLLINESLSRVTRWLIPI